MIAMIFQGFLIVVVLVLLIGIYLLISVNQKLVLRVKVQNDEVESLRYRNQVLLNQSGKDVICWAKEDNDDIDAIRHIGPDRTVVISGTDLYNIYSVRYTQGIRDANPEAPIAQHFVPCIDKRFDGFYRDHVNELRNVAVEFHDAGQLRSRISDKVLGFRDNLNALQHGLNIDFPNGVSGTPRQKLPELPKIRSLDRKS